MSKKLAALMFSVGLGLATAAAPAMASCAASCAKVYVWCMSTGSYTEAECWVMRDECLVDYGCAGY